MDSQEIRNRLIRSRVRLMFTSPFFGNLVTRLTLIEVTNSWCKTAATNGRDMWYNPKFIDGLTDKEVDFLFGHEVLHGILDHMGRREDRNRILWNIANDYVVNLILKEQNIGTLIESALYDDKYKDMASEEVYAQLLKENPDAGKLQTLDIHIEIGEPSGKEGESGGGAGDENGEGDGKVPTISAADAEEIAGDLKGVLIDLVGTLRQTGEAGKIPSEIARIVGDLTEPKMDWREILVAQITSNTRDDFSWMRPSRRAWHMDAILPGRNFASSALDVAVAIDTSGSISNRMVMDFLGEVRGIMETYDQFNLYLWTFDTKVYNAVRFDETNIADLDTYDVRGGGGTDFMPNWDHMKAHELEPDQFIMFTDGQPWNSWGDPEYCDTVFVIHGNDNIEAPFGMTAHYEES